ncbi:glycoside hydrolase family 5 protein [Glaciecola sp. 1036]|uniref:glycoside hydrolase family 5 protein n=1 Tax=Alteromonadaceae TaxID=72275 RepID=UPI003D0313B8
MNIKQVLIGASLCLSIVISGCGGGGSSSSTPNPPPPPPAPPTQPPVEPEYDIPPDATSMRDLTSVEFAALLGEGINIGNSLEALDANGVPNETAWGNPPIYLELIQAIKQAGFDIVRLPVAWSKFSDPDTYEIDDAWIARVKEVVDMILDEDMYVMINMHWDGGWMQPTYAQQDEVNERITAMWRQIAIEFRDYDDHLLFAGTNEVMVTGDYGTPTEEYYTVQNSFNQTFVDTVRQTGGRNYYRFLVVQGFNTNIDHTVNFAVIPEDPEQQRLIMEVHFYDPFQFTLDESNDNITQWGANATDPDKTAGWGNEDFTDQQFDKMKTNFIDNGVGVILGEYGAILRTNVIEQASYRVDWNAHIVNAALVRGIVPIYWDNGATGNHGLGVFDRVTGSQVYPDVIDVIKRQ